MLPKVVDLALSPCHAAERLSKACHWHAEDTAFSGDKDTLCELPSPGCVPIANKSLSPCRSAGTPKATKDRCKRQTARIQKNDCTFSDPAMSKRPSGRPCAYRNEEQMEAHPKFASVAQSYRISASPEPEPSPASEPQSHRIDCTGLPRELSPMPSAPRCVPPQLPRSAPVSPVSKKVHR